MDEKPKEKHAGGRPGKVDKDCLAKLEWAFRIGASEEEACIYGHIDTSTLYRYKQKNPQFCIDLEAWRQEPVLKARDTLYKNLDKPATAQWFLERKKKEEFSTRVETVDPDDVKDKDEEIDTLKELIDALSSDAKSQHNQPN